ncbi:hypothetical protein [Clostridium omnivorum]|uniref:Uncharacterized protein n=1 Tax=Clostridium omnivorum TaxID=1604902 RepID=A0ABQ5N9V2_9CLOT|nr:hypothetical protein [Clostridium sp. E14]GLC32038.1 hypothetical protein bsdE14_34480 [Clostridium sp. E14]
MHNRSHIDMEKLNKVPVGHPFEYKDIASEELPLEEHTEDGKRFKDEVESGVYREIVIEKDTGSHLLYKKL